MGEAHLLERTIGPFSLDGWEHGRSARVKWGVGQVTLQADLEPEMLVTLGESVDGRGRKGLHRMSTSQV